VHGCGSKSGLISLQNESSGYDTTVLAAQVAKLLNGTPEDVAVLVGAGKLRPLGRPNPNAVKFFSAVELIALLADREWLDEATKTIGQFWKRKNARRSGLIDKNPTNKEKELQIFDSVL
jgi:hypothetical protein